VSEPEEPRVPDSPEPAETQSDHPPADSLPLDSTARLLRRVRDGDARAKDLLVKRYLASLQRFAHGRLPAGARDLLDTQDLVQVTLIRALEHVERFEPQGPGSFHAYLRQALMNQIRDQARRIARSPERSDLPADLAARERSPLEQAIGREALERYEWALAKLSQEQQEAVVLRLELGFTYEEIADAIGSPTANAARMLVTRALARLAETMRDAGEGI
jgi:RNA polymerase sigma factor (sigma-70 family)